MVGHPYKGRQKVASEYKTVIPAAARGSGPWPARGEASGRGGPRVTPATDRTAKAQGQTPLRSLDSRFRGNDGKCVSMPVPQLSASFPSLLAGASLVPIDGNMDVNKNIVTSINGVSILGGVNP